MGLDEKTVSVPVAQSGTITLGTPAGSSDFIQSHCAKAAAESLDLCLQLTELDDPQRALLLLRHCHVPKLNHLARTTQPCDLLQCAEIHDSMTR